MKKDINIAIIILDNILLSAVTGLEDIFYFTNNFAKQKDEPSFKISFISAKKNIKYSNPSFNIKTKSLQENMYFDIVIIPPIVDELENLFEYTKLVSWLRQSYKKGSLLCSACVGAFILAQTKLLDDKKATTHWLHEEQFKHYFPRVKLNCTDLLVEEQNIITAGGASSYKELALYLLQKYLSLKSVHRCASLLLIDTGKRSQLSYKNFEFKSNFEDKEIEKLLFWIKANYHKELSIEFLANKLHQSPRTFLRHFKKALNITPNEYIQNLRVEEAKLLLINSNKSFEEITYLVGFNNESSFRRLFKAKTLLNPGEYRQKFKLQ